MSQGDLIHSPDQAIWVHGVDRFFGQRKVLDNISFTVKKNTVHGFLGPNGAGKTTTMRIIAGLLQPSKGDVFVLSSSVRHELFEVKKKIGILTENPPLYLDMLVEDYLRFVAQIHGVSGNLLERSLATVIEKTGLGEVRSRLVGNLSKGNRQRVGVAQALIHSPDVIILDEPTSGLDPQAIVSMRGLIRELKAFHTIILSSHLLHEVSLTCDEVTLINNGQIQTSGPIEEVLHGQETVKVYKLELGGTNREGLAARLKDWDLIDRFEIVPTADQSFQVMLHVNSAVDSRSAISRFIFEQQFELYSLQEQHRDLENIFIEMTQRPSTQQGVQQ